VFPVIGNKLEWYSKMRYDVVKEKTCYGVSGVVEGGHSFCPFGEVIDYDHNVFVTIARGGITSHEVDAPFTKSDCSDDGMKKSRGRSGFIGVKLTLLTSFHGVNEILKQGRPKVTCSDNILSSGHSRKMAPTCVTMAIIQDSIGLVNGQASTKNGVDSPSV
jgi:hypothetical protein